MKIRMLSATLICVALLYCGPVPAATCTVATATLAFGTYNPVAASANTSNSTISVTCSALLGSGLTTTVTYTILLSAGSSGTVANRTMTGGPPNLSYNIYTSASYTTIWDNTTGVGGSVMLVGPLGTPVLVSGTDNHTAFGSIPALQPVPAGVYADTLTITINY